MGRLASTSFPALGTTATVVSADRQVLPYAEQLLRDERVRTTGGWPQEDAR